METLLTNLSQPSQGNTHFIDLDILVEQGLLQASDLEGVDFGSDASEVDYAKIYYARRPLLEKSGKTFLGSGRC